jgi:hypothetical protein
LAERLAQSATMASPRVPGVKRLIGRALVVLVAAALGTGVGCVIGYFAYPAYFALRDPRSVSFAHGHFYILMTTSAPDWKPFVWVGAVLGLFAGVCLGLWLLRRLWGRTAGPR